MSQDNGTTEDLTTIAVDYVIDARGTSCPGPILAAKKGIPKVKTGQVMEVLATDGATLRDLPAWCKKTGHAYLGSLEEAGYWKLYVRRSK